MSVQAAIDAINPVDGNPDVIRILDGATYEEQVVVGGLPRIVEARGNFIEDLVAQNRDPITIVGPVSGERPTLAATPGTLETFGVFQDNPQDNFLAGVAFFGKNITFENLVIYQPGGEREYGVNGQGKDITFRNCLFKLNPNAAQPGEALMDFANSARIADYHAGVPNSALFDNCVFDGTTESGDGKYEGNLIYYHGVRHRDPEGTEVYVSSFTFIDTTFTNFAGRIMALRAGGIDKEALHQTMIRCTFSNNDDPTLQFYGGGRKTADRCIFANNLNVDDIDPLQQMAALQVNQRDRQTGDVTISNCLFSNNARVASSSNPNADEFAAVRIDRGEKNGVVVIDHCTFDSNGTAVRFADERAVPRTARISNCIFSNNTGAAVTGDCPKSSYVGHPGQANLALTLKNNLFYNNGFAQHIDIGNNFGAVYADPQFANTDP